MKEKLENSWYKQKGTIIFLVLFGIFSTFYYDSVLDKGPLNTHLWRQTDCLTFTRNYAQGTDFLSPELDVLLADSLTTGKTAGEFPLLYYVVGNIWKLTGESHLVYRLVGLIILFLGLFSLFKSLEILLRNTFWSLSLTLLLFTSPLLVVYGVSFLTDVPAFCFILMGLYFFLKYVTKENKWFFLFAIILFMVGGLLKISNLIAVCFLFFMLVIETMFKLNSLGKSGLFKRKIYEWVGFFSVFLVIFLWYVYVDYYNTLHKFKYTYNHIYPIWLIKDIEITPLLEGIKNVCSHIFISRPFLFALLFLGIANLFFKKEMPLLAYFANIIVSLGGIFYFILWGPLFGIHDYYYVPLLVLIPGIFIPFIWVLKTNYSEFFNGTRLKLFFSIFVLFNFIYCVSVVKLKTLAQNGEFVFVGNHSFVGQMKWINWDCKANWYRFERIKPYLKEIGVKQDDKIISLPDFSFNTSLYLSGHEGWTNFRQYNSSKEIQLLISKGAKYLIISDVNLLTYDYLQPFLHKKVGSYDGMEIFKLD